MTNSEPDENLLCRLNEILDRLPDKQREVLLKHVVERKTLPSIAQELSIAESTVKTHYKRAITLLRKICVLSSSGFKRRIENHCTFIGIGWGQMDKSVPFPL